MTDTTLTPPDVESDDAPVIAGDQYDDDPQVLDSLVQQEAEPPTRKEIADALIVAGREVLHSLRVKTRLMTQTASLSTDGAPYMILPADADRRSLQFGVVAADASAVLLIADDASKVVQRMGAWSVPASAAFTTYDAQTTHTGPVWINAVRADGAASPAASVTVTVCAVTV